MSPATVMLYVLALAVMGAVALRLATVPTSDPSPRCRFTWNLWVLGQVGVAVGALAVLLGQVGLALACLLMGLALQYGVRLNRRSTDR